MLRGTNFEHIFDNLSPCAFIRWLCMPWDQDTSYDQRVEVKDTIISRRQGPIIKTITNILKSYLLFMSMDHLLYSPEGRTKEWLTYLSCVLAPFSITTPFRLRSDLQETGVKKSSIQQQGTC